MAAKPGPQMQSVLPGYSSQALAVYHRAQTCTARSAQGLQAWWLGVQRRSNMSFALRKLTPLARTLRSSESSLQQQLQRRGMAADAHGEQKVNFWQAPTDIPKWKEEQIVLGVLSAWGVVIFTSMKVFGGKKETAPEPAK